MTGLNNCLCGRALELELEGETWLCHCTRCLEKSEHEDHVVYVQGYGDTPEQATANWHERLDTF